MVKRNPDMVAYSNLRPIMECSPEAEVSGSNLTGAPTNKPPLGGFFVGASRRFEPSSTTSLPGANWNSSAGPSGRAPGMARVNPDGMLAQCFGSKPPFGGFCVYSTLSDEDLLFDTGLPGANRNGAAGSQSEYQDDTSKTPGAFLNVFACEDGPKGERQGWCE